MSVSPPESPKLPHPTRPTLDRLRVTAWVDPLVDKLGHDPRSAYVEQFWLGILGPSTVWFLRHCVAALERSDDGEGVTLDLVETAAALGLGHKGGRNSAMARSIGRACRFGAARAAGDTELQVRRRIPPLTRGQIDRLPPALQQHHAAHLESELPAGDIDTQRARARRLALGLVECGDQFADAELQLARWRFHPSIAAEAVRWAWSRHRGDPMHGPEAA